MLSDVLDLFVAMVVVLAVWWIAELVQRIAVSRSDAVRAALEHEHDLRAMDDDAFARALDSLDHAA